ncbi:MAG: DUF192 domain-containing protein [Gammaproteobacteria bacterium]|nr:DUF192 domain-containing protein [Gammaproteobacteria bacterium]
MNRLTKFSLLILLFLVANIAVAELVFPRQTLQLNKRAFQLELADTNQRRSEGLMHRRSLADEAGMLFLYQRPGDYRIWMKNTLIPLLVIWLDAEARIIDLQMLEPCRVQNCPVYGPQQTSQFILELHPVHRTHFSIGDKLPSILTLNPTLQ